MLDPGQQSLKVCEQDGSRGSSFGLAFGGWLRASPRPGGVVMLIEIEDVLAETGVEAIEDILVVGQVGETVVAGLVELVSRFLVNNVFYEIEQLIYGTRRGGEQLAEGIERVAG